MENSVYKMKIKANRKFKEDIYSLSGLQRYAINVLTGKEANEDFRNLCSDLSLTVDDMRFDHVLKFGKSHELNCIDKKTKEVKAKKELFSFWLFISCLERYRKANPITVIETIQKVEITEDKRKKQRTNKKAA